MERFIHQELLSWKEEPERKVLLIRGARQVGKTYSVRQLGKRFTYFLEVNFESDRSVHAFFDKDLNPDDICRNLSAYYNVPVQDQDTLLFLDEIQTCPQAISSLRFFNEKRPGLHVIAAGSLLEFALQELPSFGVGRISHLFMFPLSFDEYLLGIGEEGLYRLKTNHETNTPLPSAIHEKLLEHLRTFLLIGGLPEVVYSYSENRDYLKTQQVLDRLITGYEDDFSKYKKRVPVSRLREVFRYVVLQAGKKFIISKASETSSHAQIKEALELLEMAGLVYRVYHTAANGIPLGGEVSHKNYKVILYDHGIFQRILGLDLPEFLITKDFSTIYKGSLTEQFAGTEIIKNQSCHTRPQLYYWNREKRGSHAEVDFLVQKQQEIIPIEVKSGTQGKMQSLRILLQEKKLTMGFRVSMENYGQYDNIRVLPLYAVSSLFDA
ncbi:MAG TPA: AAA family ATPase [Bacteroidales bacterium]|nr:AAA family ATPase [Bacteroidales bacterium]HRZ47944.1 AAA family ATPase [Bacteroidales bacterium]